MVSQPLAQLGVGLARPLTGPCIRPGAAPSTRSRQCQRLGRPRRRLAARSEQRDGATLTEAAPRAPASTTVLSRKQEGASTDLAVILPRLRKVGCSFIHRCRRAPPCCRFCERVCLPLLLDPLHSAPAVQLALPYWTESDDRNSARWKLAGVVALTLGTTGVRCGF